MTMCNIHILSTYSVHFKTYLQLSIHNIHSMYTFYIMYTYAMSWMCVAWYPVVADRLLC